MATYYVKNTGNDSNTGLSDGQAWATLSKVNSTTFSPGDHILFNRGDTWRGQLLVNDSGTSGGGYIYYSAYGTGDLPKIYGSINTSGWTATAYTNIWQSAADVTTDPWAISYFAELFFVETNGDISWGEHQTYTSNFSNLTGEYDWTWHGNRCYVYSTTDPDSHYTVIEIPQEAYVLQLQDNDYIDISYLDLRYCSNSIISDEYQTVYLTNLRVTYCEICYVGTIDSPNAYGLDVHHSNSYYAYNEIHDCGRRSISLTMYDTDPITQENVIIEHNHFYHGFHTTGLDCNITGGHTTRYIYFRNNLCEGSPDETFITTSNHVFIANQSSGAGDVNNVYIYNNILTYAHGKAIIFEDINYAYAIYNTVYGFNTDIDVWQTLISTELGSNIHIVNNIIYNNVPNGQESQLLTYFHNYKNTSIPTEIDYNLWYADQSDTLQFTFWQTGSDYDQYYYSDWSGYRTDYPSYEAHSPTPGNPLFVNPSGGDFSVQGSSPAVNAGKVITSPFSITTDYYGNTRDSSHPTIGAIEYGASSIIGISNVSIHNWYIV